MGAHPGRPPQPLRCLTTALPSLRAYLHGLGQGELGLAGRAAIDQDGAHNVGGRDGLHVLCDWQLGLLLATEGQGLGTQLPTSPARTPHPSRIPQATVLAALHVKLRAWAWETALGLEAPAAKPGDLSSMRRPHKGEAEKGSSRGDPDLRTSPEAHVRAHKINT